MKKLKKERSNATKASRNYSRIAVAISLLILTFSVPARAAVEVDINGLVCDFCAQTLEKVFGRKDEVADIDVNLDTKIVTINFNEDGDIDDETITKLINASGYSVVKIRRGGDDG